MPPKQKNKEASAGNSVLDKIPDAELPESKPGEKINFFAHQAKLSQQPDSAQLDIPQAQPDCLAGMTFVFTGTLPNLSRDQGQDLVRQYGGRVTTSISGKTTCVVIGDEAGPSKIDKIKKLKIKAIDEDGFLQLLAEMPAEGGSSEAATKAMEKKRAEAAKIQEEADRMAREIKEEQLAQQKALEKQKEAEVKMEMDDDEDEMPVRRGITSHRNPPKPKPRPVAYEDPNAKLWTDKYAPTRIDQLCGNRGAVEKIRSWLVNWKHNLAHNFSGSGADAYRAVILSGAPGIGKTTAAHLIANSLGYDVIESNASDTRSKSLLTGTVAHRLDNRSVGAMFDLKPGPGANTKDGDTKKANICLIMDEVDGMSAGDRGGVGAMAQMCRITSVPIILICNERNLPKMRPFDRVALDVQFRRPDAQAIRPRILTIAKAEGVDLDSGVLEQLVQSTRGDIRQIINVISAFATTDKSLAYNKTKTLSKQWEKETILRPFDIVARYMAGSTFAPTGLSLNDQIGLYFNDHDFAPLMVQENYLNTRPTKAQSTKGGHLELVARAAASISDADLIDRQIHGPQQQWSLMPLHGTLSCVRPSYYVSGTAQGRFNFSAYLGNNSKAGKYWRILQEIQSHVRSSTWCNRMEFRLEYLSLFVEEFLKPLEKRGADGIQEVMELMDAYFITKEDWDFIMEFSKASEGRASKLPTAVKSAFTRAYNSSVHSVPFMKNIDTKLSAGAAVKAEKPDLEDVIEEDVEIPDEDENAQQNPDDDVTKNKYIKVSNAKGKTKAKASTATRRSAASQKGGTAKRARTKK